MRKKLMAFTAMASFSVVVLSGCFGGEESGTTAQVVTTSEEANPGDVVEENGTQKTTVLVNDDFNESDESGSFEYTVKSVRLETIVASTDLAAGTYGVEKDREVAMLTLELSAKNTGYESVNCYISQATLTTPQGEVVEPRSLLGKYIDGHFVSGEEKNGSNVYIFKDTKAEDIDELTLEISAPKDNDFQPVGDEVEFNFNIKK